MNPAGHAHFSFRFEHGLQDSFGRDADGTRPAVTITREKMRSTFLAFIRDESAVTSIEYALLSILIAVAIIVSVTQLGDNLLVLYVYVSVAVADVAAAL
jgi:pilus assembly protein Flp/PilA